MLPISLDLARVPLLLAGNGARALRRLALLEEAGALQLQVFAPEPMNALARQAGPRLRRRWPRPQEIAAARLLLITDAVEPQAETDMLAAARTAGTLVNIEDEPTLSDFHSAAVLRRGDLAIAISTAGKSPALARRLRQFLGALLGPEWQQMLEELAQLRRHWRAAGAGAAEVRAWTGAWLEAREISPPNHHPLHPEPSTQSVTSPPGF